MKYELDIIKCIEIPDEIIKIYKILSQIGLIVNGNQKNN